MAVGPIDRWIEQGGDDGRFDKIGRIGGRACGARARGLRRFDGACGLA